MIKEIVEYSPDSEEVMEIRVLFCKVALEAYPPTKNPLVETIFNDLLQKIAQKAFDEGRAYERQSDD